VPWVGGLLALKDDIDKPELIQDGQPLSGIIVAAMTTTPLLVLPAWADKPGVLVAGVLVQLAHQKPIGRHRLRVPDERQPRRALRQLARHHLVLRVLLGFVQPSPQPGPGFDRLPNGRRLLPLWR
jgi:hypothetical protein